MASITTVGELREALKDYQDEDVIVFKLEEKTGYGYRRLDLKAVELSASSQGKLKLWFEKKD